MDIYQSRVYEQDLETPAKASISIEHLNGKAIMITGATGTIGSFLVDLLLHYNETMKQIMPILPSMLWDVAGAD